MVSIIVPVYNAEKYLQEAIDSVFMQAYTDWELILVNDGSTDSSMKICEKAARKTSRVKIFHTPNQGVSAARNTGLKYARGNHITFLDADDVLPMSSLSLMMDCAKTSNADIVCGKIKEIATEHSLLTTSYFYRDLNTRFYRVSSYTSIKGVRKMLYQSRIDNSVCGKLYKASLWKDIRFPTDTRYEDLAVAPLLFINADKIKVMRKTTYIYRQQPESYVHTFTLQRSDVLTVTSRLTDFFTHNYPSLARAARARQLNANFNILGLIAANSDRLNDENSATQQSEKDKAMLLSASCWNKIKELRGEALRNPSVRMKTKIGILISYIGGKSLYEKISRRVY